MSPTLCQCERWDMLKTGHTEKKVVYRVNYNLFDHIEVGEAQELTVAGHMLFDKVLVSGGCTESMMLLTSPATEHCNT